MEDDTSECAVVVLERKDYPWCLFPFFLNVLHFPCMTYMLSYFFRANERVMAMGSLCLLRMSSSM